MRNIIAVIINIVSTSECITYLSCNSLFLHYKSIFDAGQKMKFLVYASTYDQKSVKFCALKED